MRIVQLVVASAFLVLGCSSSDDGVVGLTSSATGGASAAGAGGEGGLGGTSVGGGGAGFSVAASSSGSGGGAACLESLTMRVRDFSQAHPDFQWSGHPNFGELTGVRQGILADELVEDPSGGYKPVYVAGSEVGPDGPTFAPFTGAANFDVWFRDTPGVNHAIDVELPLVSDGTTLTYDDSAFHPVDASFGFGDEGFALNDVPNNWHFTTEAYVQFLYQGGEQFTFRGDDDIWIFINRRLAIDLGGLHPPEQGSVDLDQEADALGLVVGGTYDLHVFHAERNFSGSNYRFETTDFCFVPTPR